MSATKPRVLVVSYHYPPTPAVGALRAAKFVKYLPDYGWDPLVLTIQSPAAAAEDAKRAAASVVRTRVWPGPGSAYLAVKARFGRQSREGAQDLTFDEKDTIDPTLLGTFRRIVSSVVWCPDGAFGWWAPAVLAGRRIMRAAQCAAIVTIGPPPTAHLIGLAIRRPGVRWIADFCDPWVDNPGKFRSIRSALSDYVDRRAEAAVVGRSDAILTTTERLREQFVRRYPEAGSRVHTISNGVDYDDFEGISVRPNGKFTIAHVGTLYYKRSPAPLFAAVGALLDTGALPRDAVSLVFAGSSHDGIDLTELARRYGIADLLELPGLIPRRQALELMVSADILLLFAQDQPLQVPAKTFEYIAAGRPIIALTGEGATADVIREDQAGVTIAPEDSEALRSALLTAYASWKCQRAETRGPRNVVDPKHDRRQLTGHLAGLLHGRAGCYAFTLFSLGRLHDLFTILESLRIGTGAV